MGYCIGGTLLALTLAWLAARGDRRFGSATFMVSLQDFAKVGETAVFIGEPSIDFIEQQMLERGYLDSREMSNMFNLLRSNDLIWANVVNNYLMGNKPPAFDLLYWNSDGTRMARAAHSWYLRNTYRREQPDQARQGRPEGRADRPRPDRAGHLRGRRREGPHRAVVRGLADHPATGGRCGSSWPPAAISPGDQSTRPEEGGLLGQRGAGRRRPQAWLDAAAKHEGSWWTDWIAWLAERSGRKVEPPPVGSTKHPPLADAPGTYVLEK